MRNMCLTLTLASLLIGAPALAQTTAFVGGRVIDGTGRVIDAGTVVIDGGRITAMGPAASTAIPANATRIDLKGKTLMPGMVNAHGHVADTRGLETNASFYTRDNLVRQLNTYAQYGITTVFSLGGDDQAGFALRNEQSTGPLDRARIFVAGPVITGNDAEQVREAIFKVVPMKPDLLKIRVDDNLGATPKMPENAWRAAIAESHSKGFKIAVHVYYLDDAKKTLQAGADFIAHSVRDKPVDAEFVSALKERDVCYCPTFTREVSTFAYGETPSWVSDPFFLKGVDAEIPKLLSDPARQAQIRAGNGWKAGQQYKLGLEVAKKNLKTLVDQGVRIAMGTDTGPPARFQGFFEHMEMDMMVEAGLTPMQAIVAATGDAARCHRKSTLIGTLTAGSAADVLILTANPLDNIRNLRSIEQVWIAGQRAF